MIPQLIFRDEDVTKQITGIDLWNKAIEWQKAMLATETERHSCIVEVQDADSILLGFLGDLHIGNKGTDHKAMIEVAKYVAESENIFLILLGDYFDNYNSSSPGSGQLESVFNLDLQKELGDTLLKILKNKIIAVVQGCHDDWSWNTDAFSVSSWVADQTGAVNLGHGGDVNIIMGDQEYKVHARHKFNRNSRNDVTFAVRAMYQECSHFDIGALAHKHHPKITEEYMLDDKGDKPVICVSAGTFKLGDRFGRKLGYSDAHGGIPCVTLFKDQKKMIPYFDISTPKEMGLVI